MAQSLSAVLLHLVFSTKNRERSITDTIRPDLHAFVAGVVRSHASTAYRVGGTDDHLHIACSLPRTVSVSKLMQDIKRSSSAWMKERGPEFRDFAWQSGYGVFSLGQSQLQAVLGYIECQEEHHRSCTFEEEFVAFLERYRVAYDQRYLWD